MAQNLTRRQVKETLSAYKRIENLAKHMVGPVELIDYETLDENLNDALKTISK